MRESVSSNAFEVHLPVAKAWRDSQGELWFEGVASSTAVDRQRERMSEAAMEKMSRFRGLDLLPSHDAGPLSELGVVEECWVDNNEFRVRGRLFADDPDARRLYERLLAGRRYGLSVGGKVLAAHWEDDAETGARVRVIDDVVLDHIALCRPSQAVNPHTYLAAMAKAADAVSEDEGRRVPASQASGVDRGLEEETTASASAPEGAGGPAMEGLARVGKYVLGLARSVWPGGTVEAQNEGGDVPSEEAQLVAEIGQLRFELVKAREQLVGLADELAELVRQTVEAGAGTGPGSVLGRESDGDRLSVGGTGRQSIDGQKSEAARSINIWKGVF